MLRIRGRVSLDPVANGHLRLSVRSPGLLDPLVLRWRLQVGHGFSREGRYVASGDEGIVPDYVRGTLRLRAGYDQWSGLYLLAEDEAGDQFLEALGRELGLARTSR